MAGDEYFDQWDGDGLGTMWFRHMPAESLDAFVSGEPESIMIHREGGTYWLGEPGVAGQDSFTDLLEAKKAGDAAVDEAEAKLPGVLLADAGLDPADWAFHNADPVRFECLSQPDLCILVSDDGGRVPFDAYRGEEHLGSHADIEDAVAAVTAARTPAP